MFMDMLTNGYVIIAWVVWVIVSAIVYMHCVDETDKKNGDMPKSLHQKTMPFCVPPVFKVYHLLVYLWYLPIILMGGVIMGTFYTLKYPVLATGWLMTRTLYVREPISSKKKKER